MADEFLPPDALVDADDDDARPSWPPPGAW
jgi:hypothetical protein